MRSRKKSAGDVADRIKLVPDAGLVKSLGVNHTLESAIADLVDNSIDARATEVSVRLLTHRQRLVQVEVVDNGKGMDSGESTQAMTIGHQRDYASSDLGHFGMGLKAASFGHCDTLTVWSRATRSLPVGRRIHRADFSRDFTCEILSSYSAQKADRNRRKVLASEAGTMIIWSNLRNTYRGRSDSEAAAWLSDVSSSISKHLGVVFHRPISSSKLKIKLLVDESEHIHESVGIPVASVDPFSYRASGHPGYPKTINVALADMKIPLSCHIWPPKSDVTGFRIGGKSGERFQGFYIYRNDRLLQVGGWSDIATPSPARQLARVSLDDPRAIGQLVAMNSEKQGVKFEHSFHDAITHATSDDGVTFDQFLKDAEQVYSDSRKRKRKRKPAIRPDRGFSPDLRRAIRSELPIIQDLSLSLQWKLMPQGEFLDVDFANNTLWLNRRYRSLFTPRGSLNDTPVLKALLYLLTHHVFEGQFLGARDKDEIALWKSVLGAAVVNELSMKSDD
ncbi:ATP-binding protein [Hoyosella sp. G463]|uniref:ATP-binding protein n=1 Tax=Lolliginicoccus lacisalsi TaxID=2742202 RepID=A0A927JF30_9ACTN|nr:ATP-binding protein [Lolliginicoccus lacisalsi]MBD8507900.1 ATP-binding protein [Lolliginicoccus lacisalsi]